MTIQSKIKSYLMKSKSLLSYIKCFVKINSIYPPIYITIIYKSVYFNYMFNISFKPITFYNILNFSYFYFLTQLNNFK